MGKSASETLGAYLLGQLEALDVETEKHYVYRALKSADRLNALIASVAQADLVISAAPLYVDSLPAPVTKLLETLARRLDEHDRPEGQQLVAISNCGFPEAHHNDVALAIHQRFAQEAGFVWAGGLAMGGGESIRGRELTASGGMARDVAAALDLAATALAERNPVPQEAQELMAQPLMPSWIYRVAGGLGWWIRARQHGTQGRLRAKAWDS
jgi:multimeric flavodoxin WrbA